MSTKCTQKGKFVLYVMVILTANRKH